MKKAIVFPKGHGMPYCVDVPADITCEWIARNIGCEWVEIVRPRRLPEGIIIVCDEEGLLKPNELNPVGSWFYESDKHGEPIVGNIMILKEEMGDEGPEFAGMTDDEVNKVFDRIGKEE
jgi:hypothetical protein